MWLPTAVKLAVYTPRLQWIYHRTEFTQKLHHLKRKIHYPGDPPQEKKSNFHTLRGTPPRVSVCRRDPSLSIPTPWRNLTGAAAVAPGAARKRREIAWSKYFMTNNAKVTMIVCSVSQNYNLSQHTFAALVANLFYASVAALHSILPFWVPFATRPSGREWAYFPFAPWRRWPTAYPAMASGH